MNAPAIAAPQHIQVHGLFKQALELVIINHHYHFVRFVNPIGIEAAWDESSDKPKVGMMTYNEAAIISRGDQLWVMALGTGSFDSDEHNPLVDIIAVKAAALLNAEEARNLILGCTGFKRTVMLGTQGGTIYRVMNGRRIELRLACVVGFDLARYINSALD